MKRAHTPFMVPQIRRKHFGQTGSESMNSPAEGKMEPENITTTEIHIQSGPGTNVSRPTNLIF